MRSYILFSLIAVLAFNSCTYREVDNNGNKRSYRPNNSADKSRRFIQNNNENNIYYGLYSPDEISKMLKKSGAAYMPEAFLPTEDAGRYSSSSKQAVCLGVYGADFSIAELFNDTEEAIKYMNAIGQLSDKLGVPAGLLEDSAREIEENMGNIDSLSLIVAGLFENSTEFLLETGRESAISLIMMGGWIEGIYQALNILETDSLPDPRLVETVVEQKYSLNFLMTIMRNQYEDPDVAYYYRLLEVLASHFEKPQIYYKRGKVEVDTASKIISAGWSKLDYSLASIEDIKQIVSEIRSVVVEI